MSDSVCDHCQAQVCTRHFIEHVKLANNELTYLSDEVNTLVDSVQQQDLTRSAFEEIERWREIAHRRVDELCEEKKQELKIHIKQSIDQQMVKLRDLHLEIKELIDEGDASFKQIKQVKNNLEQYRKQYEQLLAENTFQLDMKTTDFKIVLLNQGFFQGNGTLLSIDHQRKLNEFYGNERQKWMLVYKATRDDFSSANFHRFCDKPRTYVDNYSNSR